jgi:hypothetical protein
MSSLKILHPRERLGLVLMVPKLTKHPNRTEYNLKTGILPRCCRRDTTAKIF